MQARYYSPEMKRFISADPTGLKGGVNFYTYADGNPLNSIDPEGLCARPSLFGRTSLFGGSSSFSGIRSASFGGFSPSGSFPGISSFSHENLGFGERMFRFAATLTPARDFTTAIQGRDPFGNPFSRSLSTGQRWAAAGSGALNFGMSMAGSAALGRSAGMAMNRGSYALSAARSAAPYASPAFRSLPAPAASRALTTSRITDPARMLSAPNPAQTYAAKIPSINAQNSGLSNPELVRNAGQKAFIRVQGEGPVVGTQRHEYATKLLKRYQGIYGDRGLRFGESRSLFGQKSILDVRDINSRTIYDWKFGNSARMSPAQRIKYETHYPDHTIQIEKYLYD